MNAPIDTLAFAERFETAGFGHDQARALVQAIAQAQESGREDLVTKGHFDLRLADVTTQMREVEARLATQMRELEVRLTKQIGDNGKDISNRLWSTITIIAGVSTAISATIGAGVTLLLKAGGL